MPHQQQQSIQQMQDNEEGFSSQAPFELVDYHYQPCSKLWASTPKSYCSTIKKNHHLLFLSSSHLINTSIHNQWLNSLHSQSHKNIVFSATAGSPIKFSEQNLRFTSNFESGNMEIASRRKNNDYELYMKPDTNTKAHFQWFYFKVSINKGNKLVRFVLKNFIKATMLYSKGLKPFCRSLNNPDFHQFRQIETPVKFSLDPDTDYYQLQFHYNFQYDRDEVQFCSQPPYTFNHLQKYIERIKCKKLTLGKTVLGNKIPYLLFQAKKETKAVIVAIARQHPGEAVGSWMMEGFINYLQEKKNFDYITWVVIPMVNIDGVILGNNRTGILGHDFNRNWAADQIGMAKNSRLFPQISGIVTLVKSLKRKYPRKVKMFLDLHGHSSQPNVFTYGPPHEEQSEYFFQCRIFPELLSKKNPNFKLDQSSYVLAPQKKNTARSVIFYNLGVPFTYTIESTFGLMNSRNVKIDDFIQVGYDIGACAHQFMHTAVIKGINEGVDSLLQEIKIKYADAKNQGEQYDSASEASDQDPNRKKIEEIVLLGQAEDSNKKSGRYEDKPQTNEKEVRRKSAIRGSYLSIQRDAQRNLYSLTKSTKTEKKRMNTEGQLLNKKKECVFPSITTKNGKMSFDSGQFVTNEEILKNLKVNQIQKRLHKLRNSKLGKKILIINAYSS